MTHHTDLDLLREYNTSLELNSQSMKFIIFLKIKMRINDYL